MSDDFTKEEREKVLNLLLDDSSCADRIFMCGFIMAINHIKKDNGFEFLSRAKQAEVAIEELRNLEKMLVMG